MTQNYNSYDILTYRTAINATSRTTLITKWRSKSIVTVAISQVVANLANTVV